MVGDSIWNLVPLLGCHVCSLLMTFRGLPLWSSFKEAAVENRLAALKRNL